MARRTYPRPLRHHEIAANEVLTRHAFQTGEPISLPVPIELIIETTFGLSIEYDELDEASQTMILGALAPAENRIILNTRHQAMFDTWIGPERFTLAHELAHWIYDAENPNQLALDFDSEPDRFCYHRESPGLSDDSRIREMNANKFAACLLLPRDLVLASDVDDVCTRVPDTALAWGVSKTTLAIRLSELGLVDSPEDVGFGF